jgi:group I intron endonuclease
VEGIYKIENIVNGRMYIGSSVDINKRINRHKNDLIENKHINCYLQRDFNKYGMSSYLFECIELCNMENLKILEQKYLDEIFSNKKYYEKYYNIGKDATGGDNLSNNPNRLEIIKKIKNGLYKRYNNESELDKLERRENLKGLNNPNFGKKWNKEKRDIMSMQRKGIESKIKGKSYEDIHGEDKARILKENISNRMTNNLIGEKNGFFGKIHSEENLKFFSESQKNKPTRGMVGRLKPFHIDNVIYYTLSEASKKLNINYLTIRNRLISKKFTNYIYIEDIDLISKLNDEYLKKDTI